MRRFETPYLADWFAASLRWIVLVGLTVSLSLVGQLTSMPFVPLVLMLIWNIVMSILAGISVRTRRYHRQVVLAVDFILAALFFWAQGGLKGPAVWAGLMPILTGAIYFEMWGTFLVAAAFAGYQYLVSGLVLKNSVDT